MNRAIPVLAAIAGILSSQVSAEVIFRATSQTVAPTGPSAATLTPSSATVSAVGNGSIAPTVLTAKNSGTGPTGKVTVGLTAAAGGFSISSDGCSGVELPASGTCTVSVARTATDNEGSKSGSLSVSFARGGAASASFAGTATGFDAVAAWTPSTGTASIASTASPGPATEFKVSNSGYGRSGAVTISFATATTDFELAGGTCGASSSLLHGEECTVLVSRTGAANDPAAKLATLRAVFASNGTSSTATVSGTIAGLQVGACTASTANLSFCTIDGRTVVKVYAKYVDACDAGQTWNGAGCNGTVATATWNDGTYTNETVVYVGASGTGPSNTTLLTNAANTGKFKAAKICRDMGAKWYLPGYPDQAETPALMPSTAYVDNREYWTSSEQSGASAGQNVNAMSLKVAKSGNAGYYSAKNKVLPVRCYREF